MNNKDTTMSEQSDTPRTDDQSVRYYDDATGTRIEYVAARFARQLERELTAARAEIDSLEEQRDEWRKMLLSTRAELKITIEHRDRLERELATALRDRDNALSDWTQADTDSIRALHERNEAIEQRDRLAEAISWALEINQVTGGSRVALTEALQSLTTNAKSAGTDASEKTL